MDSNHISARQEITIKAYRLEHGTKYSQRQEVASLKALKFVEFAHKGPLIIFDIKQ
jgi:hypothetical protein